MSWVIYLFGSGLIFFAGSGCVMLSLTLFALRKRRWHLVVANVLCVLGVILVGISATPLPYWVYVLAGVATAATFISEQTLRPGFRQRTVWIRGLTTCCWICLLIAESLHQVVPTIRPSDSSDLYIIADSVTAGVGDPGVKTWPKLLAQAHPDVKVHDFSRMGATVSSAYAQAERVPPNGGLVLVEIGGNDVLGTTTAADFELNLERLLSRVCTPGRSVVMFEVPLPPLSNNFGQIQRRLAVRHGVPLIPKRVLLGVLTAYEATIDSIHLSQSGHDRMAVVVWGLIGGAYQRGN